MKLLTILVIALVAILSSEACISPPSNGPTVTSTTAKSTTTTKKTDCPMEKMLCLAGDASNLIDKIKTATSSALCSKWRKVNVFGTCTQLNFSGFVTYVCRHSS